MPLGPITDDLRTLLSHGVKAGGLNLRNPETGADRLFQASSEASEVLFTSLLGNADLESVETPCVRVQCQHGRPQGECGSGEESGEADVGGGIEEDEEASGEDWGV